jgi:cephalosporin hydroxylase
MSTNPVDQFASEVQRNIEGLSRDGRLHDLSNDWIREIARHKYAYNFRWLGRPIIQFPQDIIAIQEIIWSVRPELIIETGIAHGGSLIFSASILELNSVAGGPPHAEVLGIDIDIRAHNRAAIQAHPLSKRISMIQGSSIDPTVIAEVRRRAHGKRAVLVCLDSNHTHEHVLAELEAYAPLTTIGSYCVVLDTIIEDMPKDMFSNRPWGVGNNPKTAVREFLKSHPEFSPDRSIDSKLLITVAPEGYLKRLS